MIKVAKYITSVSWLDKKVVNPKTKRLVKVRSLPQEDREKYNPEKKFHSLTETDIYKNSKERRVFNKASDGDLSVLKHKDIHLMKENEDKQTPLHRLAQNGWRLPKEHIDKLLAHPQVGIISDRWGHTPLHFLADHAVPEVLNHKNVSKQNQQGSTPLHNYARNVDNPYRKKPDYKTQIEPLLKHPLYNKLKDKRGYTPKNIYEGKNDEGYLI